MRHYKMGQSAGAGPSIQLYMGPAHGWVVCNTTVSRGHLPLPTVSLPHVCRASSR